MKKLILIILFLYSFNIYSQELFVISEPASNMPAGSIGIRLANSLMKEKLQNGFNYHLMPEIMWGANKNLMVHTSFFLSNRNQNLVTEGVGFYAKYRFFSKDDIHSHFRMAVFNQYSFNNADIHQEEINLMGHNSGLSFGLIATQLIHKVALSSSLSIAKALDNSIQNPFPKNQNDTSMNYTFSFGKLIYPKKYTSFKQTNINAMLEIKGQKLNGNGKSFLDIVPSIQLIINSQARLDFAYVKELYTTMERTASNGILFKIEYTIF